MEEEPQIIGGRIYLTQGGKIVKIVEEKHTGSNYHCVKGDDQIWRYARNNDAGRATGSDLDMSDPNNLIVNSKNMHKEGGYRKMHDLKVGDVFKMKDSTLAVLSEGASTWMEVWKAFNLRTGEDMTINTNISVYTDMLTPEEMILAAPYLT